MFSFASISIQFNLSDRCIGFRFCQGFSAVKADADFVKVIEDFAFVEISAAASLDDDVSVRAIGIWHGVLLFLLLVIAPAAVVGLVRPPCLAVLLVFAHVALVDRALLDLAFVVVGEALFGGAAVLHEEGKGDTRLVQQVFPVLAA